jgi:hypothetical protein
VSVEGTLHITGGVVAVNTGSFKLSGASQQTINGNGTINIFNMEVSNSQGVELQRNLGISNLLTLSIGDLNLNGNDITLNATASISEDRANNHIILDNSVSGGGAGLIIANGRTFGEASLATDIAGLGLFLQNGAGSGSVTVNVQRGHQRIGGERRGITKYFDVALVSGTVSGATIALQYADANYLGIAQFTSSEADFTISRIEGGVLTNGLGTVDVNTNTVSYAPINGFSTWTVSTSAYPLPITLSKFKVNPTTGNQAVLTWTTSQEISNIGFEIQKSINGNDFEKIGFVDGAGNSNQVKNYQFTDTHFTQSAYYRLKQIDQNGDFSFSQTEYSQKIGEVNVFPNPIQNFIHVQLQDKTEKAKLTLRNLQGNVLLNEEDNAQGLEKYLEQYFQQANKGIYVLTLYTQGHSYQFKLVKP